MNSERINFLAVVTAVAGLTGFIGVYAKWFSYSYPVSQEEPSRSTSTGPGTGPARISARRGHRRDAVRVRLHADDRRRRSAHRRPLDGDLKASSSCSAPRSGSRGPPRRSDRTRSCRARSDGREFTATVAIGLGISLVSGILATVASILLVSRREAGVEEQAEVPATTSA